MYQAIVIVQNQCKHLKSVHVSANFYGEYQSNQEAKQNMCLVFSKRHFSFPPFGNNKQIKF